MYDILISRNKHIPLFSLTKIQVFFLKFLLKNHQNHPVFCQFFRRSPNLRQSPDNCDSNAVLWQFQSVRKTSAKTRVRSWGGRGRRFKSCHSDQLKGFVVRNRAFYFFPFAHEHLKTSKGFSGYFVLKTGSLTNTDTVIDTIQSRYLYFIESFAHKKYAPPKIRHFGRCIFLMLADIIIFNN